MVFGLGWVAYLLWSSSGQLREFVPKSPYWLAIASMSIILSLALNGVLFYLFLNSARNDAPVSLSVVFRLHFVGQVLRYLPGRLWGIVYQVGSAKGAVSKGRLARANIDWMFFSLAANSLVAISIVLSRFHLSVFQLALFIGSGWVVVAAFFLGGADFFLDRFSRILPSRVSAVLSVLAGEPLSLRYFLLACIVFLFSWGGYIIGWQLLSKVFPVLEGCNMLFICAAYTLASVVGILSVITPAGLGVREASFVAFAGAIAPPPVVAFFAVFGRVWLMAIDLLLCVLSIVIFRRRVEEK
jgi:uncharacterized membrane protein YbhN (UPF0104 family)